jgi:hypothetical protein
MTTIKSLLRVALLTALLLAAVLPARGQVVSTDVGTFTNLPTILVLSGASNQTSIVKWRQNKTLSVFPYFSRTNAGNSNVVFTIKAKALGYDWNTANTITLTNQGNGTTGVRGYHLITPTMVNGVDEINLSTITSADNAFSIFLTNVVYSWSQ